MKVGGIRRVVIPPSQGYQNTSQEPIPPNVCTMFFFMLCCICIVCAAALFSSINSHFFLHFEISSPIYKNMEFVCLKIPLIIHKLNLIWYIFYVVLVDSDFSSMFRGIVHTSHSPVFDCSTVLWSTEAVYHHFQPNPSCQWRRFNAWDFDFWYWAGEPEALVKSTTHLPYMYVCMPCSSLLRS